ncbi:MAG: DUF2283 domain-containing protein [Chloroflexi bacterium]|nr:DUF2283 domain-containing protein [Chloroflexota bacterium]
MKLEHDEAADAVYIQFSDQAFHHMESLDDNRHIDYAADGSVIGVEILYPSRGVAVEDLPRAEAIADLLRQHRIRVFA